MIIDKPMLDKKTPEENLAIVDRWIADTADKLNYFMAQMEKEKEDGKQTSY